ncbi:hypothetical protein SEA_MORGANA_159 [Gordonia phage Morgana]|uniref:Uncharacterized protein n=1 Tax=Gordonia phage Morgana TaxID=3137292 RepID=A0AAX4RB03_9CAUD
MAQQVINRPATDAQVQYLDRIVGWIREVDADDAIAAQWAAYLDGEPEKDVTSLAITRCKEYLTIVRATRRTTGTPDAPAPGFYLHNEQVYEVKLSKADRPYAKVLSETTGRFTYDKGAIYHLEGATPMTLAEAAAYGKRTGRCCVCGRTLTNPTSVEAGIGPVCSGRFA